MSIDTESFARARHIVRMHDILLARCLVPCLVDHVRQLVGNLRRGEIVPLRRRWMLRELLATASDELASAGTRWTPYYDAALRAIRDDADTLIRHVDHPETIVGFSLDDMVEFMIDWDIERHHRLRELVLACERAGGRSLAEVWDRVDDVYAAPLVVGAVPDPTAIRERLRRMVIAHMRGWYPPGAIGGAYLDAARAASLGTGSWQAVEQWFASWYEGAVAQAENNYDDGWHDHVNSMVRVPRQKASFDELCSYITQVDLGTLRDTLGNPFRDRRAA